MEKLWLLTVAFPNCAALFFNSIEKTINSTDNNTPVRNIRLYASGEGNDDNAEPLIVLLFSNIL